MIPTLTNGPADSPVRFLFAHGAGAGMESPFMLRVAEGLASRGVCVVRFEFPYMAARREGSRRGPDRMPVLLDTWRTVIAEQGSTALLFLGGKSMGGRIATMIADEMNVRGVVCFGYPFHPPGQPEKVRTAHLETLRTPTLILQGERDPFGTPEEVSGYALSHAIRTEWLPDGDHSFKPRRSSGTTETANVDFAIDRAATFLDELR